MQRWLPKDSFIRGVAVLAGGTALAQGLGIAVSPIITRLYTPSDFGTLAVYASILGMISGVSALKYELAIPIARRDGMAINALALATLVSLGVSALMAVVIVPNARPVALLLNTPALAPLAWLIPIGVFFVGLYRGLSYWAIRRRAYGRIARTKLPQSVGSIGAQVGAGLLGMGPIGLIVGSVVSQAGGILSLGRFMWIRDARWLHEVSLRRIKIVGWRFRRFPQLASPSALLNSAGLYLPPLLIAGFYGAQVAGWLALAERITSAPLKFVGTSVSQVYLGEAAKLARDPDKLTATIRGTMKPLALWAIGPIAVLLLAGPSIFEFVFGSSWREAGVIARIIALLVGSRFVTVPVTQNLNILERQDLSLLWNSFRLVISAGAIVAAGLLGLGHRAGILSYAVAMSFAYLALIGVNYHAIRAVKTADDFVESRATDHALQLDLTDNEP